MDDAPLSTCPSCGQQSYTKMLSAAGFQLKGSGWYATDFKNGNGKAASSTASSGENSAPATGCGGNCACH